MKYKIMYHSGDEVTVKTKVASGVLSLAKDSISVSGDTCFSVPYTDIKSVELFRLHGLGRMLKLICSDQTLFLGVIRFQLFGYFALINFLKTGDLCEEIKARIGKK